MCLPKISIWRRVSEWSPGMPHEDIQKAWEELRTFTSKLTTELWGPSPDVPEPIQPEEDFLMII